VVQSALKPWLKSVWATRAENGSESVIFMRKRTRWVGWFHIVYKGPTDPGTYASWADPSDITHDEDAVFKDLSTMAESGVLVSPYPATRVLRIDVNSDQPERLDWALDTLESFGFTRPTQIPP